MGIDRITEVNKNIDEIEHVEKFNPFHDRLGRFSTSNGMNSYSANPKTRAGQLAIGRSDFAGYGHVMNIHGESKGENIRQNQRWITTGAKPTQRQLQQAQQAAALHNGTQQNQQTSQPSSTGQRRTRTPQQQAARQQAIQNQQTTQQNTNPNIKNVKQTMRSGIKMDVDYDQSTVAGAKNKEFRGTAHGKDLTKQFDASKLKATDSYHGQTRYSNAAADMQGFNSPAKKVSQAEFDKLAKACGDEFYRTVNVATVNGKNLSAKGMKDAYTTENDLKMNGPLGRLYGDGIYTVSSKMIAGRGNTYTQSDANLADWHSKGYGDGKTTLKMTWLSKPNIITQSKLDREWNRMSSSEQARFGNHKNTYAVAKGYDALFTDAGNYMTVFNRSKIAVLDD